MRFFRLACIPVLSLLLIGCSTEKQDQQQPSSATQETIRVAIVGDETRNKMLAAIGSAVNANVEENENLQSIRFLSGSKSIQIESATDESLVHHAKIASQADIVLLADNVADGPMPIHREHVILTRQMGVPQAMILLTNCDLVGDPELLELVELEVRELLNNFGLPGDEAQCVLDQERAKTSSKSRIGKGPKEIVRLLTESAARRIPIPASEPTHLFSAEVYALARVEAPQGAMTISTGPLSIIMGGNVVETEVAETDGIAPGANGQLALKAKGQMRAAKGERFLILNRDRLAGVGVVTEIRN